MRMLLSFLPRLPAGGAAARKRRRIGCRRRHQPRLRAPARHGASHREWLLAKAPARGCGRNGAGCSSHIDAVICPIMPTAAYPHDHSAGSGNPPHHDRRHAPPLPRPARMARRRDATGPAGHGDPDSASLPERPAGRRADRRPLARGPHAAEACGTDRARVRRFQTAANV